MSSRHSFIKFNRKNIMGFMLLSSGFSSILISIKFHHTLLSYIGLSFIYWGMLLILVLPGAYIKTQYNDELIKSNMITINDLISKGKYEGDPIYVPVPRNFYLPQIPEIKNEFIYIDKIKEIPEKNVVSFFDPDANGIRVVPPGIFLVNFIEKQMDIDFHRVDIEDLNTFIQQIYVDELDLFKKISVDLDGNEVIIKYSDSKINATTLFNESDGIIMKIGDPILSSLACVLTRVIKKPIYLTSVELDLFYNSFIYKIINDVINIK